MPPLLNSDRRSSRGAVPVAIASAVLSGSAAAGQLRFPSSWDFPGPWLSTPQAFDPAGIRAALIADLGWYLTIAATVVFVIVIALLVVAAARKGEEGLGSVGDEIESVRPWLILGVSLTVIVLIVTAVLDFLTVAALETPESEPRYALEVVGKRWWWEIRLNGEAVSANEIHVPVGEPVLLTLSSDNVIHSFWVPQLAGKHDLIPGAPFTTWIQADEPGVYRGECAEFCGVQHANMGFLVIAEPPELFEGWLERIQSDARPPREPLEQRGRAIFIRTGCAGCHTVRGTSAAGELGPDLTHIASRRTLGAATLPNTLGNLGGWVVNPWAVKPGIHMPPQDLTGEELQALLGYLQSLE